MTGHKEEIVIKNSVLIGLLIFIAGGCAAYKELKPKPEISFLENGYIEILDKDEKFELKKEKKYFIRFPHSLNENNYLVLEMADIDALNSYLTRTFDDGKGEILKLTDESPDKSRLSVYALDITSPIFFWVIEQVTEDMLLDLNYRYIAQWRFKFETKHDAFEKILKENRLDAKQFETIGIDLPAERIEYDQQIGQTQKKTENIKQVQSQLQEIESIFPENILNSQDAAYLSYLELKSQIDKELQFQETYLTTLNLLKIAVDPKRNTKEFLKTVPSYLEFLQAANRYPENAQTECKRVIAKRFPEIPPYIQKVLLEKNDTKSIDINIEGIVALHEHCAVPVSDNLKEAVAYIKTFNTNAEQIKISETELQKVKTFVTQGGPWPGDNLYTEARTQLSRLRFTATRSELEKYKTFHSFRCSYLMNETIKNMRNELDRLNEQYQRADVIVPQINSYKQQQDYRQIIRLLKENSDLTFLHKQYPDIDERSFNQQKKRITGAIADGRWYEAEQYLNGFYNDSYFLRMADIQPIKNQYVRNMEDTLFTLVKTKSLQNAQDFIEQHKTQLTGIDSFYVSAAFQPVHSITFTSGTTDQLISRKEGLQKQMDQIRTVTFPATAIELLYQDFVSNINNNGVAKVHAIVKHGHNYQGTDKKIKNLIAECDPNAAKWLTEAKKYRKIFVAPLSPEKSGKNKYMFRLNIQIPSEAQFPVFDINIKLTEELARNAALQQWYEKMDFNGNLLKNEGRFTILAPTGENGYECTITPLQVQKTGNNILEVTFAHPSFKVFEVSVMGQKPIIRKN
jgi:hypothetical protein